MEESSDTEMASTKVIRNKRSSETEDNNLVKKSSGGEIEILKQNGTGNNPEQSFEMDPVNEKPKTIKITKITKVKTGELKSPNKKEQSTSISEQKESPSSPSAEDEFCGFDCLTLSKEEIKKKDAFLRILDQLNASCSSPKESFVKQGEAIKENGFEEDMTVDTGNVSDADSGEMEIDMEKDKDTSVLSDRSHEKTKDSDVDSVKSAGDTIHKRGISEAKATVTDKTKEAELPSTETISKGISTKVELCGTCDAVVNDAEEGICCDGDCERWFHLRCSGLTQAEYDELGLDENAKWACSKCSGMPPRVTSDPRPLLTVRKDLGQFSTPSPLLLTKKRPANREGRSPKIDIANPAFLKPFDFGWKRELVYRSTNDSQNRRQGDIYYYTPKGKKLRSLREISDHLIGTDLTQDNFTFWKEPLGIDDPEKEIIRDAKFKLVHKDPSASPAALVKKPITPKTPKIPKTPKVTPKLTATVSPLDTTGSVKVSASVTPRVVLKGKASPAAGPKFKVTPSKTTTPGQTQKIVISKGEELVNESQKIEAGNMNVKATTRSSNPGPEELLEMSKRNKFKRYGLLANAKTARKRGMQSTLSSTSSDDSGDSSTERLSLTGTTLRSAMKMDLKANKRSNAINFLASQPKSVEKSKVKPSSGQKREEKKKQSKKRVHPLSQQANLSNQIPFSLIPDKSLSQNFLSRRPSPPEIQFRPSNPSSYGCQTSSSLTPRMAGPSRNPTQYQSNMTNSTSIYETVLIVDTASSEKYVNSPKSRDNPLILNNSDCSIEIVSVESLNSKDYDGYSVPSVLNQPSMINNGNRIAIARNKNINNEFPRTVEMNSPISLGSSSTEEIDIVDDDDDIEDRLPPFLQRTSPPPRARKNSCSPNRSPPSLQRIPSPPPLVFAGSLSKPHAPLYSYPKPPCLSSGPRNLNISLEEDSSTRETGSSRFNYRKVKKERFHMRQKARREMMELKKAYLKEKKLFTRKKFQEKALQVKYLSLKVKNKELKMALLQKSLGDAGR